MAFYHDGQPTPAAFGHPDAGFAMNAYPHHEQPHSLAPVPSAPGAPVYPFIDPSNQPQMYHQHSYADMAPATMRGGLDHHVWQAPQAPRLSAAAARASRQHMMAYAPAAYAQPHGASPWYGQPLGIPQPYQQPRTHQQLEQQLLVQHHLAKAHERQNGASMYQPAFGPGSAAYSQQQPLQSHPHPQQYPHQPAYQHPAHSYHAARPADHDTRIDRQRRYHEGWASSTSHHAERPHQDASHAWSGWHHASQAHRGSVSYLPQQQQHMYPSHPLPPALGPSDDADMHSAAAWASHSNSNTSRMQAWNHAPRYAQQSYAEDRHAQSDYRDLAASNRSRQEYLDHRAHFARSQERSHDFAAHPRDERLHAYGQDRTGHSGDWQHGSEDAHTHPEAAHWQSQSDARHDVHNDTANAAVADEHDSAPVEEAAAQTGAPAPCSPGSLEKSALPIAAIGAQLIWNACTALFDPELLIEAHETADEAMEVESDEAMSPAAASMPSSSSSPSLNTPDTSPWSSTVLDRNAATPAATGDWNAFRSPFGPDRLPQLRPQAHSFTFGSDHTSAQHDLHRMAVGAERARSALARDVSPAKRSRQGSGQSEATMAHSSGASTASSSEPGTPASLAHESPALSSTVSAHSVETARSPLRAGLGMSLDGSRSESALRARRNSSKTSPKLVSSKWSGRMRDNVLAVLRLVSPDWRWSNNDHLFVSLSENLPTATAKSSNGHGQGRSGGRDSVTSIVTSYANEPSPAFRRFVHQVLAQTLLSPPAFLLGILNALRLLVMAQLPDGSTDPVVLELFAQPTSAAPFKLFTLGMMIANKHLDDNTFLNKTWNEVTGIPLAELNQTEAWFLKKCNYEVNLPDETWIGFLNRLQSWEEKRSSRGMHRDQDSSKRLLLVLDEALGHFDAIPALQLDDVENHPKAVSPVDMWARSHHRAGSLAVDDDTANQQHCRSAPAAGHKLFRRESDGSFATSQRPTHVSRASLAMDNPSTALLRTSSDFVTAGGAFKDFSPLSESGKLQSGTMSGPLMPSALLNGSRALFLHGSMFGPLATSN